MYKEQGKSFKDFGVKFEMIEIAVEGRSLLAVLCLQTISHPHTLMNAYEEKGWRKAGDI